MVGLMNPRKVRIGMMVKIIKIEDTHRLHNSNSYMHEMVGRTVKVRMISNTTSSQATSKEPFMISFDVKDGRDCVWSPADLEYAGPAIPKKEAVNFDPKNLII